MAGRPLAGGARARVLRFGAALCPGLTLGLIALLPLCASAGGTVAGTVAFTGRAPKLPALKLTDPGCQATTAPDPSVQVSGDGKALANVVVRLEGELPDAGAAPRAPVVVEQTGCMYRPHVTAAVKGQKVLLRNGDATAHDVHALARLDGGEQTVFNVVQPPGAKEVEKDARGAEVLKLKCDDHPWMSGYVVFSPHRYFAVSDGQGAFEIRGVPPGRYTVEAWHERYGTRAATVTVEEGQAVDPKLSYSDRK